MALVHAMADGPPPAWKSVRNLHALKNFGADIKVRIDLTSAGAGKITWDYDTCEPCTHYV